MTIQVYDGDGVDQASADLRCWLVGRRHNGIYARLFLAADGSWGGRDSATAFTRLEAEAAAERHRRIDAFASHYEYQVERRRALT